MENVRQMLTAMETGAVEFSSSEGEMVSVTIDTVIPPSPALRTRITALLIGEFGPAEFTDDAGSSLSVIRFKIDGESMGPRDIPLSPLNAPHHASRAFLMFRDGVPSGTHRVAVFLREAAPSDGELAPL
jgi:hypothetical protein